MEKKYFCTGSCEIKSAGMGFEDLHLRTVDSTCVGSNTARGGRLRQQKWQVNAGCFFSSQFKETVILLYYQQREAEHNLLLVDLPSGEGK